jgi:uncharacterized protein YdeI (YjbR/CyaY-like superfamily)
MALPKDARPVFFAAPSELRSWLEKHHDSERELYVGYYKKGTGRPSLTWPESVDEALCFGWIDGVRRRIDDDSYCIRFTPRKARSIWSAVNIARVSQLVTEGRMTDAGMRAFEARSANRSAAYSYDSATVRELDPEQIAALNADSTAWAFWEKQPPSYRKAVVHWIVTAKRPETRAKRLATLIEDSAQGRRIGAFVSPK